MNPKSVFKKFLFAGGCALIFFRLLTSAGAAWAADDSRVVELFSYGKVSKVGNTYTLGREAGAFLKIVNSEKERCLFLNKPDSYNIPRLKERLKAEKTFGEFFKCNLLALIYRLKSPERMIVSSLPRGKASDNREFFERAWLKIVKDEIQSLPFNAALASAVWFGRQGNFARSAYILERLFRVNKDKTWVLEFHHDAYSRTSMLEIDKEIAMTKSKTLDLHDSGKNFALLIGTRDYSGNNAWKDLSAPINDIRALKKILASQLNFRKENIFTLENPTHQTLVKAFLNLRTKVKPDANLLIYYAGHGAKDDYGNYFWLPSDVDDYPVNWTNTDYILGVIKNIRSLHTLLIVDSCFSGSLNNHQTRSESESGVEVLYGKSSRQLITSGGDEPVIDKYGDHHSVFADVLLRILRKQPRDSFLSAEQLFSKLQHRVSGLSNQTPTYDRIPDSGDQWGQFYFSKRGASSALNGEVRKKFSLADDGEKRPETASVIAKNRKDSPSTKSSSYLGIGVNASFITDDRLGFNSFNGYNMFYNYKINSLLSMNIRLWKDWATYDTGNGEIETTRIFISSVWQRHWAEMNGIFRQMYYGLGLGMNFVNNLKYKTKNNDDISLSRQGFFIIPEIGWKIQKSHFVSMSLNLSLFPYYYRDDKVASKDKDELYDHWKESKNINQLVIQTGFGF